MHARSTTWPFHKVFGLGFSCGCKCSACLYGEERKVRFVYFLILDGMSSEIDR